MKKGVIIGCSIAGAVLLVVAVCGGLLAVTLGSVFGAMAAVSKPADDFLTLLGNGDTTGAYQSGASGLRAAETPEQFAAFVKSSRLDQYRSSNWNKFNTTNSQGTVEGTVTLKDGSTVPLKVNLVNEGGWKVVGLELTGVVPKKPQPQVPSEAEAKKLVNRDLGEFRKAVEGDDFTRLHASLHSQFKATSSAEQLREAFKVFIEQKEDLIGVGGVEPKLGKAPALGGDGVLTVEGEYPSRPVRVLFLLEYVAEDGEWKLTRLKVNTKHGE